MDIEEGMRQEAMRIAAAHLESHHDAYNLIKNAQKIEAYLRGEYSYTPYSQPEKKQGLDFNAKFETYEEDDTPRWSGTAQDLIRTINSGHTLITKARQIGMTTLLLHFAAAKAEQGQRVVFFNSTRRMEDGIKRLVPDAAVAKLINFVTLNNVSAARGYGADYVIVDGLTYLPFRHQTDFLATLLPMGGTRIFVGEPSASGTGLFADLWKHSTDYQKVVLTWYQPLFLLQAGRSLELSKEQKIMLGADAYSREFECRQSDAQLNAPLRKPD